MLPVVLITLFTTVIFAACAYINTRFEGIIGCKKSDSKYKHKKTKVEKSYSNYDELKDDKEEFYEHKEEKKSYDHVKKEKEYYPSYDHFSDNLVHYGGSYDKKVSYGKELGYGKGGQVVTKVAGCNPPVYKFPKPEPECLEDKDKCPEICEVKCKGPHLNKFCEPSCDLKMAVEDALSRIDCTNEKIAERIALGRSCEDSIKCLLTRLEKARHDFVALFCPDYLDEEGKRSLLCLFREHDELVRKLLRNYVKEATACYKDSQQREDWAEIYKNKKLEIQSKLKRVRLKIARSIHKIVPTIASDYHYIVDYLLEHTNIMLLIVKDSLLNSKDDSAICECMDKTAELRKVYRERLSVALACTGCR